jgi:choline kinase
VKTLVLLAAGAGTRLRPLTETLPKCLISIDGHPLLDALVSHFAGWVDQTVVVTGHLHEEIEKHLARLSISGRLVTRYNPLYATTNSLFSAAIARDAWSSSQTVVISNTDVLFDAGALKPLVDSDHEVVLSVDAKPCDAEDMKVLLDDGTGRIARISKDLPARQCLGEFTGVVKCQGVGVQRLSHSIEHLLRQPGMAESGWYDLALDFMAQEYEHLALEVVPQGSYWEIDTPDDLGLAQLHHDRMG